MYIVVQLLPRSSSKAFLPQQKIPLGSYAVNSHSHLQFGQPLICFWSLQICNFWKFHINGIHIMSSFVWLLSINDNVFEVQPRVVCNSSFLFIADSLPLWIYHICFIHLPVEVHLDCLQFGTTINNPPINMYESESLD